MPYDPNLDVKVYSEEVEFDNSKIIVSVMSYNEGQKKLQIGREKQDAEGNYKFAKLGRLSKEEVEKVIPLMEKVKEQL